MIKLIKWLFVFGMFCYCLLSSAVLLYEGVPQKYATIILKTKRYNGVNELKPEMKAKIKDLEAELGHKITVTSGARNKKGSSAHNAGLAIDIRAHKGPEKYEIVKAAYKLGFKRIGIYDRHVHLDIDDTKAHQNTIWLGTSK